MTGKQNLANLINGMTPQLNDGEYVFVRVKDINEIDRALTICEFKEQEGTTVILDYLKDSLLVKRGWINCIILDRIGKAQY